MTIFNCEPTLDDLLSDPIIVAMMRSDGVDRERLGFLLKSARSGLRSESTRRAAKRINPAS